MQGAAWPETLGRSDVACLLRDVDWSRSPLGEIDSWPAALRTSAILVLESRWPMALLIGPHAIAIYNDAFAAFPGERHPALLGNALADEWPEAWETLAAPFAGALAGGASTAEHSAFTVARDGVAAPLFATFAYSPVRDERGEVLGVLVAATSTTPRSVARHRAPVRAIAGPPAERRAVLQMNFLASLGDRVVRTLDRNDVVNALAEGLVPEFADWTLVTLVDENGTLVLTGGYHHDPERTPLLSPFLGSSYDLPDRASVSARVFETGEALLLPSVSPAMVRPGVRPEFADVVEELGMHSCIAVPIAAEGQVFGTFHILLSDSDRAYTEADLPFFTEVGRRMGFALHNAEMYERESRIAHAFQAAALPEELPSVPGLGFSCLYEPASREANVGGDFYDAFRLPDGRVIVAIGDVAGAGVQAVATMAALRQSIRAIASVNADPEFLLRAADGVFSDAGRPPFASAFVAVIDPLTSSMRFANAGHPAPVLRHVDGSILMLDTTDILLGLNIRNNYGSRRVGKALVPAGALLALYTDGLIEAHQDALDGERRLVAAVRALDISPAISETAAVRIRRDVLGKEVSHDDMALLTVLFEPIAAEFEREYVLRWKFSCDDERDAHGVRDEIAAKLRTCGLAQSEIFSAETVFSELVGNALRYTGVPELEVALDLTQESPVLHVLDGGEGFFVNPELPPDAYAERGRGLYIVIQLTREFRVVPRTNVNGSHARAVLYGRLDTPKPGSWRVVK